MRLVELVDAKLVELGFRLRADDEALLRDAWPGEEFEEQVEEMKARVSLEVRRQDMWDREQLFVRGVPHALKRTDPVLLAECIADRLECALRAVALDLQDRKLTAAFWQQQRQLREPPPPAWDAVLSELGVVLLPLPMVWADRVMTWAREHLFAGILAGRGIETSPHVTVKYGLTTLDDRAVVQAVQRTGAIALALGPLAMFTDDEQHDTLVISLNSPRLEALRRRIEVRASWDDAHALEFKPHITVAYCTKGSVNAWIGYPAFEGTIVVDVATYVPKAGSPLSIPLARAAAAPGQPSGEVEAAVQQLVERIPGATVKYVVRDPVTHDIAALVQSGGEA